ncbi:MAG: hypothetical protein HRT93_03105 [Piscirickettsiaceae bacterium]|nr:hypothetical protein [Piscirickettsiaceae bacterium]
MEIYRDGSIVKVEMQFVDDNDNLVSPTSATYRVLSEDNTELVAETTVTINDGDSGTAITVNSPENTLAVGAIKGLRTVELTMVTALGIVTSTSRYVVEAANTLVVGETSFQTYNQALLTSLDMVGIDIWSGSTDRQKKAAMIEAYVNITKLNFNIGNISEVDLTLIDSDLLAAIAKAQIAEADFMMGGDTVEDKRRTGLMSETVGESSNMFRPGKPLVLAVSEKALRYLTGYITWSRRIG